MVFPGHGQKTSPVVLFRSNSCASPRHFGDGGAADAHRLLDRCPAGSTAQLSGNASVAIRVLGSSLVATLSASASNTLGGASAPVIIVFATYRGEHVEHH